MAAALGALGDRDRLRRQLPERRPRVRRRCPAYARVVDTVSAWRVSVLNIATAVRNLPEPPRPRRGAGSCPPRRCGRRAARCERDLGAQGTPFLLGVSLAARRPGHDRAWRFGVRSGYTPPGRLAIVVLWLFPWSVLDCIADFRWGIDVLPRGGLMIVVGSTWVLMHNARCFSAPQVVFGRSARLAPVLKLSIAYPLRSLFRTGVTLAMFTLVVFTLVVGTTVSVSFMQAWNDEDPSAAASTCARRRARDAARASRGVVPRAAPDVTSRRQSIVPLEATAGGPGRSFAPTGRRPRRRVPRHDDVRLLGDRRRLRLGARTSGARCATGPTSPSSTRSSLRGATTSTPA